MQESGTVELYEYDVIHFLPKAVSVVTISLTASEVIRGFD